MASLNLCQIMSLLCPKSTKCLPTAFRIKSKVLILNDITLSYLIFILNRLHLKLVFPTTSPAFISLQAQQTSWCSLSTSANTCPPTSGLCRVSLFRPLSHQGSAGSAPSPPQSFAQVSSSQWGCPCKSACHPTLLIPSSTLYFYHNHYDQ